MKTDSIQISGIDRYTNYTDAQPGACEELINISPDGNSLKIEKSKKAISANINYTDIHIHECSGEKHYIGRNITGIVLFNIDTGSVIKLIHSVSGNNEVYINSINNMLVISDKTEIKTYVYVYKDDTYESFYNGIDAAINLTVTKTACPEYQDANDSTNKRYPIEFLGTLNREEFISNLNGAVNKFRAENKKYTDGYFLIALTLTLFDNTEIKTSNIQSFIPDFSADMVENYIDYTTAEGTGGNWLYYLHAHEYFNSYTLNISIDNSFYKQYKSIIKSINLYVSRPIQALPISLDSVITDKKYDRYKVSIKHTLLNDSGIEKELMYKQKSWTLEELKNANTYTLELGSDSQTTEKTMEVENGWIDRAGKMMLYNNRLHFYDSMCRVNVDQSFYSRLLVSATYFDTASCTVIAYIKNNAGEDVIIKKENVTVNVNPGISVILPYMVIFPDSRCYKIVFLINNKYAELSLSSSPVYNYSFALNTGVYILLHDDIAINAPSQGGGQNITIKDPYSTVIQNDTYKETRTINVTAQNNPIYFPVEHSYLFDGDIVGIGIAIEQISESQIGQYPINVFTNKGIFALEQGSGTVLYGYVIPLNSDVCSGSIIQTRTGIVYIANNNVYFLSGRRNICLSTLLDGPIDTDIRGCNSYARCCCNNSLYNVQDNISAVRFKTFIFGSTLAYSAEKDELIISNSQYKYSYVFSFIHKNWHKITESYTGISNNILLRPVFANHSPAKAAHGKVMVTNVITQQKKTIQSYAEATISNDYICAAGDRIALVVDGKQVSSALFTYKTKLSIIVAILCRDLNYIEDYATSASNVTIYSLITTLSGKNVSIVNITNDYTITATFSNSTKSVTIQQKGIGESVGIGMNNLGADVEIEIGDSVITVTNKLCNKFNELLSELSSAAAVNNEVIVTAKTPGAVGNALNLSILSVFSNYTQLEVQQMQGGKDISLEADNYSEIVDYTQEQEEDRLIHIQTRPFTLGKNIYSTMYRTVLNLKAQLGQNNLLSIYIYASNDLKNWSCVSAAQKKGINISSIRLNRISRSYKYYVVMIGGIVNSKTNISNLLIEYDLKMTNNIR